MKWLFIGWFAMANAFALFATPVTRPDLTGRVTHADGSPVPKATILIYTAGPKHGTSSLCPSCYPDCSKKAQTDADGRFKIESLDPNLLFRLLVVAGGEESTFVSKVDPANTHPEVVLKPLSEEELHSKTRIAGVVLDPDGKPVVGATIGPQGVQRGAVTQWGGTDNFVDPMAVADDTGHFVLQCQNGVDTVYAVADGRNVAQRWVELKPGGDYLVRMQDGVAVTGQIEQDGRPLKGVIVGLVTKDRACGNFFRCDEIATDADGRFLFMNAPPERKFVFYEKMGSLHGKAAVPSKIFTTGKTGTKSDLGVLRVQPAHLIAGRVVLSDGKPVPPGTKLILGREEAWDSAETTLDAQGRFEFKGVPEESVGLVLRIKGYKFSHRNPNLDWLNGGIVGRVDQDVTNLTLLLEPGQWDPNEERNDAPPGADLQPRNQPLRSGKF